MTEQLLKIKPDNESLLFLSKRIKSKNYRGSHLIQQQRYSYQEIVGSLLTIYAVVKDSKLNVPKGDPKTDDDVKEFSEFKEMVILYRSTFGKGSYISVKKIDFLNFARMGFLDRFDSKGKKILVSEKATKMKSVSISETGLELLFNPNNSKYIFTKAMDTIFEGFIGNVYELIQSEELNGVISFQEFFLFVSYIGLCLDGEVNPITVSDIVKYISSFRKLKKHERNSVIDEIVKIEKSTKNLGKKKGKIDFTNWKNQAGSIFNLLSFSANLNVDAKNRLTFGKKKKGSLITLERSLEEKKKYFAEHNINYDDVKGRGYELHHVYPIALAESDDEFIKIDSWENLLYLDGKKHAEITQKRNRHIKLDFISDGNIKLSIPSDDKEFIELKMDDNIIYSVDNQNIMLNKNKELLDY